MAEQSTSCNDPRYWFSLVMENVVALGQQLSASLQRQRGPFLTHAFCQRCLPFLLFGPTDAQHFAFLMWCGQRQGLPRAGKKASMSMGCQWSTTTALTQLQYWQDKSWDWQPLSSEGHWKPYPSPQPFLALLLPQTPLRLCPHTQRRMRAFCTNLRGAVGRLLGASVLLPSRIAQNSLSDLQVTFWGQPGTWGTTAPGPHTSSTHPEQ